MARRQTPGTRGTDLTAPSPDSRPRWAAQTFDRRLKAAIITVAACLLLASCWLPDRFLAEVRLSRNGDYALVYQGDLVWVPLADDIRARKLTPAEITEKTDILIRDLSRDEAFKTIVPLGGGRFKVSYERLGHLGARDIFAFPRRSDALISLETFDDGRAIIRARSLKTEDRDRIASAGLGMQGRFRVVSDGLPLKGNPMATAARDVGRFMIYDWTIATLASPPPFIEIDLTRSPAAVPRLQIPAQPAR